MKTLITLITLVTFLFRTSAGAGEATLEWDANTETDLAGYKIHYGLSTGAYTTVRDVGKVTTATATGLSEGTAYYFAVTAYNTAGMESGFSNEVAYTIPIVQRLVLTVDALNKKLTWTDTVTPTPPLVASYLVERAGPDGLWLWSAVVSAKEMALPQGLPRGTYSFRVSPAGQQNYSNVVTVKFPSAPTRLRRVSIQTSADMSRWETVAALDVPVPEPRGFVRLAFAD